jgi:hypothetical protein
VNDEETPIEEWNHSIRRRLPNPSLSMILFIRNCLLWAMMREGGSTMREGYPYKKANWRPKVRYIYSLWRAKTETQIVFFGEVSLLPLEAPLLVLSSATSS